MTHYVVGWTIDIEADSPREAAQKALEIQRRPGSIATVFDVAEAETLNGQPIGLTRNHETIDLSEGSDTE